MKAQLFQFILLSSLFAITAHAGPLKIALNWKAETEFGGFYAAQMEGFYKAQNLDVEIIEGGSGTPTVQMLSNKQIDFAVVSADEIILSQARNSENKVKALYAVYQTAPYIVMTHKERQFKSLKEVFLSEGIISIQSGLPYYQFLIKKFGPPRAKIVPYLGGVGSFLNNPHLSQQGFLTTEPLAAEKSGAQVKNFMISDEGFNPYLVVLATTETTLKEHPEVVKKLLKAVHQGWTHYLKNPERTNKFMANLNKSLNLETFELAAKTQKKLIELPGVKLGSMSAGRWAELSQQLLSLGLIKSSPKTSDLFESLEY